MARVMTGVAVELKVDGEAEDVWFSTRRSGEAGKKMKVLKKAFHKAEQMEAKHTLKVVALGTEAEETSASDADNAAERLAEIAARLDSVSDKVLASQAKAQESAEKLVQMSLAENYGNDEAIRIMDTLTDKQISLLVGVIETGEVPENFFPPRVTQPSGNGTSPDVDSPGGISAPPDTTEPTSTPEESQ